MSSAEWERPDAARRRRPGRLLVVVAGVVVLAGIAARAGGGPGPVPATEELQVDKASPSPSPAFSPSPSRAASRASAPRSPVPQLSVPSTAAGEWALLPDAPLEARSLRTAWTGSELVFWGGASVEDPVFQRRFHADGAAWSPRSGAWRVLAASPLDAREGHVVAWSGRELLVWGGAGRDGYRADGAAYDPTADRWRLLAPAPLAARSGAAGVWMGSELLVAGGSDLAGGLLDGAAYDPATDRWRVVGPLPGGLLQTWQLGGMAVPGGAMAWSVYPPGFGSHLARYSAADNAWSPLPVAPLGDSTFGGVARWDGAVVAVGDMGGDRTSRVLRLADGAQGWEPGPEVRGGNSLSTTSTQAGGILYLVWAGENRAAAYDLSAGTWSTLPRVPRPFRVSEPSFFFNTAPPAAAWTGQELLVLSGRADTGTPVRLDAWRPADGAPPIAEAP